MIGEIDFYQSPGRTYRESCTPGQVFLAPVPFLLGPTAPRLRLDFYDKKKPHNSSYTIENTDLRVFRPDEVDPIYELGTASDQFVLCVTHKFRPVVIVSQEISQCERSGLLDENCCIVVPLYGVRDVVGQYKYREEFLLRVQAYEYPNLFYLPESTDFDVRESLVRLDRTAVLHRKTLIPRPTRLTEDALFCLRSWQNYYLGAELDAMFVQYRADALEQLRSMT